MPRTQTHEQEEVKAMDSSITILKTGGGSIIGIVISNLLIISGVLIFEPRPSIFITFIMLFSICWEAVSNYRKKVLPTKIDIIKRNMILLLYMLFVLYLTEYFGGWGILGIIIIVFVLSGIILYRRWTLYMDSVRKIESMIWGKPLDHKGDDKDGKKPNN